MAPLSTPAWSPSPSSKLLLLWLLLPCSCAPFQPFVNGSVLSCPVSLRGGNCSSCTHRTQHRHLDTRNAEQAFTKLMTKRSRCYFCSPNPGLMFSLQLGGKKLCFCFTNGEIEIQEHILTRFKCDGWCSSEFCWQDENQSSWNMLVMWKVWS